MKTTLTLTALLVALSACNLAPEYRRPDVVTPAQWHYARPSTPDLAVSPQWWQAFGDTGLNHLMTEALAYNNDLAAARQRVLQAKAQAKIAGAGLWPSSALRGDASENHNSRDSQQGTGQFSVAYEVDLWGANRARSKAGSARLSAEAFTRDALQLVVMANVGQVYFNLLALDERKRIAADFLNNVMDVLAIIEARFRAGAVSELDVLQQKTELANARANLDLLNQQYALTENALAILLGHPPHRYSSFPAVRFFAVDLPELNPLQPASLLERRPDVRQQEMELIAAHFDIGVARAALYPKLQLNLDTALSSGQPASTALSLAAGLTQPLFQGGSLEGGLEYARARNAELVETYRKTVLTAFKEVEDAAAIRHHAGRRLQALADAVNLAKQAYRLSQEQYRVGLIDFQTLLSTQRSLLNAENSHVQARLDVLVAMVQLYQALGGGWPDKTLDGKVGMGMM
ncbi:MAG: efflux transporter outer membrane subunit [Methylovulum sp.]|nr:efflux transporter outer membrane subunit [Methylovulum sp.]